jgi:hypothetical protein
MRLYEVKVLEPERNEGIEPPTLDGYCDHPKRYRYVKCWVAQADPLKLRPVGGEGVFLFIDGYCEHWLGKYQAWVVSEVDRSRYTEPDRFEEVTTS